VRVFITGATGFIGGHIAEACAERGWQVQTIARPSSDTTLLQQLGAVIERGDLGDTKLVQRLVLQTDAIIHCAAKVGDWGPVEDYRKANVETLRGLLEASKDQPLQRFVHLSSLGVYPAKHHYGTDESVTLPLNHADGYTQTKVEAEELALRYYRDFGVPVVVLRPGFVYGPRDRTVMPRLIENLRTKQVRYLGGKGNYALNTIYVKNLVDAVFLALERNEAVGQIYNLTDGELISKRRFIEAVADALELERPKRSLPLWVARLVAWWMERRARRKGATKAPRLTQARLKFLGLNLDFSIEKAKRQLGYRPRVPFDDAMYTTMTWYKQHSN
jgi:nucleoside-diphosphate-sugar epimerase